METAFWGKIRIRGEESLLSLIVLRAVGSLLFNSLGQDWIIVEDWRQLLISCCLLGQILAVYKFPLQKGTSQTDIILFRPGISSGVYCVLLVPLAVLAEVRQGSLQSENGSSGGLSEVSFLLATGCAMLLAGPSQLKRVSGIMYTMLVCFTVVLLLPLCIDYGRDYLAWLAGFITVMGSIYYLPHLCPISFTFGELCVVSHLLGCAIFRMVYWILKFTSQQEWSILTNDEFVYIFISVLLLFATLASTLVLHWDWCDNIVPFVLVYIACSMVAISVIMFLTGHNPVLWLLWFIFGEWRRISLLVWWLALSITTVISFMLYTHSFNRRHSRECIQASTAARKVFHCVVVAVYIPGLAVDPYFLLLASVVALAVLGILEISRVIGVQWLGPAVESSFRIFVDDRDQGHVLLTHIYLLVGLSLPLWLAHDITVGDIRNFCGVISLGIGDTVACVVGLQYGKTKWPGTKKSVEGTVASVFVQLIFLILAFHIGWFEGFSWICILFAVLVSSLFEAFASQIDNLVLPLFMLAAL